MNSRDVMKLSINTADQICTGYLSDLTDQELLKRPCPGCNHLNWQVGHLVASEHGMMSKHFPMPPLPAGFAEKYSKETATLDNPEKFCTKAELLQAAKAQRAGTLAAIDKASDADLDKPSGFDFCPTLGALLSMQGSHWMMHAGQWAVVRRQCGRKPLF